MSWPRPRFWFTLLSLGLTCGLLGLFWPGPFWGLLFAAAGIAIVLQVCGFSLRAEWRLWRRGYRE